MSRLPPVESRFHSDMTRAQMERLDELLLTGRFVPFFTEGKIAGVVSLSAAHAMAAGHEGGISIGYRYPLTDPPPQPDGDS